MDDNRDGPLVTDENRRFVEDYANPHSWLLMADNLHEQATALYNGRRGSGILTKTDTNNVIIQQTMGVDKSVFLLGGFALENAIKAFLVYENPNWISGGRLYKRLKSHKLTALQKLSKEVPHPKAHTRVLEEFESGLDSWFRYPCALTIQATIDERHLHKDLWQAYQKVMSSYGKKLGILLNKGWHGPHRFYGRWSLQGEFLGYKWPLSTASRAVEGSSTTSTYKGRADHKS